MIETDRLTLRRLTVDDAAFILALLNEPSFLQFIGDRGVRTLEAARTYLLDGPIASYEKHGFGLYLTERKADGVAIGICGLVKRDALPDVDIGFAFFPQFWAQGYAFESASAVMVHAKADCWLARIAGITKPDNAGSIRVLEKLGLRYVGMVRISPDGPEDKLFTRDL